MPSITLHLGDITTQNTDAIVNAANSSLLGGGGVDGAIHRAGGPAILESCKHIRNTLYPKGLLVGQAVLTTGGNLPAKYVIHTVGPQFKNYSDDSRKNKLADCYLNSLKVALDHDIQSISFPSISTGAYGCPIQESSQIAVSTVKNFLHSNPKIQEVRFVLHSEDDYKLYEKLLEK
ncbi:O-acetyl-ADP-ribose deacetylase [Candidatus Gracilibacteria bacterium]|nr:O-acetyl-ADP-ribose deacetylase [Candidatus Gracilibacteria bacterium]